jgi:membrane protein
VTGAVLVTTDRINFGRGSAALAMVMMFIGSSAVFAELLTAMNAVWRVRPREGRGIRGVLRDRFWPFAMVVVISGMLLGSLVLSSFIHAYSVYINRLLPSAAFIWPYVDLAISFAVVTVLFALLFKLIPDARVAWSDVWVGSTVTAIFFALGKYLFSLYLGTTAIQSVYGAAGSLFVILVWVYVSTSILLLGAEFTHIFAERHGHSVIPKANAVRID